MNMYYVLNDNETSLLFSSTTLFDQLTPLGLYINLNSIRHIALFHLSSSSSFTRQNLRRTSSSPLSPFLFALYSLFELFSNYILIPFPSVYLHYPGDGDRKREWVSVRESDEVFSLISFSKFHSTLIINLINYAGWMGNCLNNQIIGLEII